jgi:hypothetical protein
MQRSDSFATPRRLHVLPEATERLLECAKGAIPAGFSLVGGTALAEFYLGHRLSDDLDYFGQGEVDIPATVEVMVGALMAAGLTARRVASGPTFGRIEVGHGLRVDLVRDSPPTFGESRQVDGVWVASLLDIAVGKLGVFVTRREGKDAFDLAALAALAGLEPPALYPLLFRKDQGLRLYPQSVFEPLHACAERLPMLPRSLRSELTAEVVQAFLQREAERFWDVSGLASMASEAGTVGRAPGAEEIDEPSA